MAQVSLGLCWDGPWPMDRRAIERGLHHSQTLPHPLSFHVSLESEEEEIQRTEAMSSWVSSEGWLSPCPDHGLDHGSGHQEAAQPVLGSWLCQGKDCKDAGHRSRPSGQLCLPSQTTQGLNAWAASGRVNCWPYEHRASGPVTAAPYTLRPSALPRSLPCSWFRAPSQ